MSSYVNQEAATLILRSIDATNRGIDDAEYLANTNSGRYWEWNNIDLRNLLGELILKYDKFNILLISAQQGTYATNANGIGSTAADNVVNFRLRGLNLINPEYDVKAGKVSNSCVIGGMTFNSANNGSQQIINFNNQINSFQVGGSQVVNLSISYERISTKANPAINPAAALLLPSGNTGATYPEVLFIFKIFPIKEPVIDTTIVKYNKETKMKI